MDNSTSPMQGFMNTMQNSIPSMSGGMQQMSNGMGQMSNGMGRMSNGMGQFTGSSKSNSLTRVPQPTANQVDTAANLAAQAGQYIAGLRRAHPFSAELVNFFMQVYPDEIMNQFKYAKMGVANYFTMVTLMNNYAYNVCNPPLPFWNRRNRNIFILASQNALKMDNFNEFSCEEQDTIRAWSEDIIVKGDKKLLYGLVKKLGVTINKKLIGISDEMRKYLPHALEHTVSRRSKWCLDTDFEDLRFFALAGIVYSSWIKDFDMITCDQRNLLSIDSSGQRQLMNIQDKINYVKVVASVAMNAYDQYRMAKAADPNEPFPVIDWDRLHKQLHDLGPLSQQVITQINTDKEFFMSMRLAVMNLIESWLYE